MFGYAIDLPDLSARLREAFTPHWRGIAGAFFLVLALAAIEYDEFLAPSVSRISDSWTTVATDFSRKLATLSL
jgi:hypothetical protein